MLVGLQSVLGYVILVITIVVAIMGGWPFVPIGLFMGFVLISLSRILSHLEVMRNHQMGLPLKRSTIQLLEAESSNYPVVSESLKLTPDEDPVYKLLKLDGETYIRLKVFMEYIVDQQEREYLLHFPDSAPFRLLSSENYSKGDDLFDYHHMVYAKLSAFPVRWWVERGEIHIEHQPFSLYNN